MYPTFQLDPECDQTCLNTAGSYECGCREGFVLDPADNVTCTHETQAGHLVKKKSQVLLPVLHVQTQAKKLLMV